MEFGEQRRWNRVARAQKEGYDKASVRRAWSERDEHPLLGGKQRFGVNREDWAFAAIRVGKELLGVSGKLDWV